MIVPVKSSAALAQVNGPVIETARLILRTWRADDIARADGVDVLSFAQAEAKVRTVVASSEAGGGNGKVLLSHAGQWESTARAGTGISGLRNVDWASAVASLRWAAAQALVAHFH